MILTYIIVACLVGSTLSALLAAFVAWRVQPRLIPLFVSYAVGALLGVVFLDLLPHIFEQTTHYHAAAGWLLVGILAFFVLEKLVLWRHNHDHAGAAEAAIAQSHGQGHAGHGHAHAGHGHAHETGPTTSAWMIIIGDGFHNFTDGLAIAAAFMADVRIGVVTSIAIIAHELPQELGDFLVLIHSGFSRRRALFWNVMSSFATLLGALLAYAMLVSLSDYAIMFLCFAASSMIYVAIADLIPGLHKRSTLTDSAQQISLIGAGVASIWMVHLFV
ncbi:MAG: ZIP family metal transporter [Burkholderiales bacterium]|nr:ZIP family metal transporter [Burkholderiales bacterium]